MDVVRFNSLGLRRTAAYRLVMCTEKIWLYPYDLDGEYRRSFDIEEPPADFLEWNDKIFRKSIECDNEYIQVSYVSTTEQ